MSMGGKLKVVDSSYIPQNNITAYIKYKNIRNLCNNTNDIIANLSLSSEQLHNQCEFNKMLLTAHGLIDVEISSTENDGLICTTRVNYTNVVNLMIILILVSFSILFIIVLYNAFLITINERQKEYSVLNSIGGTEGQILKIIFIEAIFIGLVSIIIGSMLSVLIANNVLHSLNNILIKVGYHFKIVFNLKYILLALFIIVINIYIAVLIPSVKASTTSVIQGIRKNKQIKSKRKNILLEKILPIEGRLAIKNVKRNKSKYRIITFLLIICTTSYITISTYISYQKEASNLVNEFDVDAAFGLSRNFNINYKKIFDEYEKIYGNKVDYIEYKMISPEIIVNPKEAIIDCYIVQKLQFDEKDNIYNPIWDLKFDEADTVCLPMTIIGLDDKTYNKYIQKINAKDGDIIIYNNATEEIVNGEATTYAYNPIFKNNISFNLKVALHNHNYETYTEEYRIINSASLNGKYALTEELIDGFAELKTINRSPAIFVNMGTYDKIINDVEKDENFKYVQDDVNLGLNWTSRDLPIIKIKCKDIANFKIYMEDFSIKNNMDSDNFPVVYYSLMHQEKIIYINIIELLLKIIIIAIVTIGTVSAINAINASLVERKEDFNILYRLGATKGNIRKMLIDEGIYMFIKATIISIILSIPIIWKIVKQMENVIILNKLLIPYGKIAVFFAILFVISILVMIYSSRMIKEE